MEANGGIRYGGKETKGNNKKEERKDELQHLPSYMDNIDCP